MSISDAIDALEKIDNPRVSLHEIGAHKHNHSTPKFKESRAEGLNELKNSIGLCLDCMSLGGNAAIQECRIKH
jgi:hypothetical protein